MEPFDLLGPLPSGASTIVLEASAGTGKTFTLAGLVTRYVAEGEATLDEMLLITFGRAANARAARARPWTARRGRPCARRPDRRRRQRAARALVKGGEELAQRRHRLRDALAGFDAATIATTHQFCRLVLLSWAWPATPTPG